MRNTNDSGFSDIFMGGSILNYKNLYLMLFNNISCIIEKENGSFDEVIKELKQLQIDAEEAYIEDPFTMLKAVGSYDMYVSENSSVYK